jgi:NAD(P)-dependent dehydrogenase (short-subunit alcohol dehydrogenase family)
VGLKSHSGRILQLAPTPPIINKFGLPGEQQKNHREMFAAKALLKRLGTADEVAQLVRFLLSEESSYIIGTESIIDGGLRLA